MKKKNKRINWLFFLNNRGEAGELDVQLENELAPETADEKPGADEKTTPPAGNEEAGKREATNDDPEFDLELNGENGQPEKKKVKLSELRRGYLRESDYTKKTQEISALKQRYKDVDNFITSINSHDGLRKLIHGIVVKSGLDSGKVDDEAVNNFLSVIEDKQEKVEKQQDDIEKLLSELDPDGPHYKALKRQYEENKSLQKKLEAIEQKMSGFDTFQKSLREREENETLSKATSEAAEVFKTTLADISDANKGGYDFLHDVEKQRWQATTQSILQKIKWPDGTTLDAFREAIKRAGKAAYDHLVKEREAYQSVFMKTKAPAKPATGKQPPGVNTEDLSDEEKQLFNELNE